MRIADIIKNTNAFNAAKFQKENPNHDDKGQFTTSTGGFASSANLTVHDPRGGTAPANSVGHDANAAGNKYDPHMMAADLRGQEIGREVARSGKTGNQAHNKREAAFNQAFRSAVSSYHEHI